MQNNIVSFDLQPGFRGFVAGVVNALREQQVYCEVKRADGTQIAAATMEAQGNRSTLKNVMNNRPHWSFGPFDFEATIFVRITHKRDGSWANSKVVGPLTVDKYPESDYPMTFRSKTVVSEDLDNISHDDCTVNIIEYK
ncbi:hypothetical protein FRB97_008179 [Tulasnella sp. 331]|nr:hypothetical protein FRB97_008179 [Tulasnella sp. 331]